VDGHQAGHRPDQRQRNRGVRTGLLPSPHFLRLNLRLILPPEPAKPCAARVCALWLSAVRSEGRSSRTSVQQALNDRLHLQRASTSSGCSFLRGERPFCHARAVVSFSGERVAASRLRSCRIAACFARRAPQFVSGPRAGLRRLASDTPRYGSSSKRIRPHTKKHRCRASVLFYFL